MKMPKFGTKNTLFEYFWPGIWVRYCHIWNQQPRIFLTAKCREKTKNAYICDQKCLIWVFWNRIWDIISKQYCHIWNQLPQICLIAKFLRKTKMPKFGTKNAWFMYFWTGIWKQYCHIWIQDLLICLIANFLKKQKCLNLGPKMPFLGIFDQECLTWLFSGKTFTKTIVRFEINILEFV